jgi:predicted HTH transcriptional regulator
MDILSLIAEGEHQQQDFKFEISSACKIARSLSAFANTEGGRLLIGVKDNGSIAGVRSDEEMYMVQAAGEVYCRPPVICRMKGYRVDGKTVVIAETTPATDRPVRARLEDGSYKAFVRIADENILASPVQMELWRNEESTEGAFVRITDAERALLQLLEDSNGLTLSQFCRRGRIPRRRAIILLADFIRFGLVRQDFENHTFRYRTV